MRKTCVFFFLVVLQLSCGNKENGLQNSLSGNWIILYPDHQLKTSRQREIYGRHQDSLVSLYGLKLITLRADGTFTDLDSLQRESGRWFVTPDSMLKIREAGKGFNPFNASVTRLKENELQLTQSVRLEDEKIKLVWHLKRIEDGHEAARLFSPEANGWRKKPASRATKKALRERLSRVLNYYGDYFILVSREAIYFLPNRVPLPFRYYQHAIGLQGEMTTAFEHLYYDKAEAEEAFSLLKKGMGAILSKFPTAENYTVEYGLFLKKLAEWIGKAEHQP